MTKEEVEKEIRKLLKDNNCGFEILYKKEKDNKLAFKIKVKKIK